MVLAWLSEIVGLGELVQDEANEGNGDWVVELGKESGVAVAGDDAAHDSGKWYPVGVSREGVE